MNIPFEYCAYRYLSLWERKEKDLHKAMKDCPSPKDLRSSLKHFSIHRNFEGLADDNVAKKIIKELENISDTIDPAFRSIKRHT
jgi:hypothetical protein